MNLRIRELADQCEGRTICECGETGFNFEKFAELIIKECADIGERYVDGNYEVRNQILEHFGLEEE
jgi:hypothetical protein